MYLISGPTVIDLCQNFVPESGNVCSELTGLISLIILTFFWCSFFTAHTYSQWRDNFSIIYGGSAIHLLIHAITLGALSGHESCSYIFSLSLRWAYSACYWHLVSLELGCSCFRCGWNACISLLCFFFPFCIRFSWQKQ